MEVEFDESGFGRFLSQEESEVENTTNNLVSDVDAIAAIA